MNALEQTLKALANRRRLAVLRFLGKSGETSVNDIAEAIHLSVRSTSKHLHILYRAEFVRREKRSKVVFYALPQEKSALLRLILDQVTFARM